VRVGISFERDPETSTEREAGALVRALHPFGIAATAGLEVGDRVLKIGGEHVYTSLAAAAAMRDGHGLVSLVVVRPSKNRFAADDREVVPTPSITPAESSRAHDAASRRRPARAPGCAESLGNLLTELAAQLARCLEGPVRATAEPTSRACAHSGPALAPVPAPAPATRCRIPSQEEVAARQIQATWRGNRQRLAMEWQRWATSELQRTLRGRAARRSTRGMRTEAQAAVTLQMHTRGFIDRQWCMMVRHEIARRRAAMAEEAAAATPPRGIARKLSFDRANKARASRSSSWPAEGQTARLRLAHHISRAATAGQARLLLHSQAAAAPLRDHRGAKRAQAGRRTRFFSRLIFFVASFSFSSRSRVSLLCWQGFSRPRHASTDVGESPRSTPRSIKRALSWGRRSA